MAKIFISYRRADSNDESRRIYDALSEHFGEENIFRDKDRIPKGSDFRTTIEEYVFASDEMLVLIGQSWLNIREHDNLDLRRLDNPEDFVRIEIDMGLRHVKKVTPVVLQNAPMPTEEELPRRLVQLAFQNAYFVRPDHFDDDLQALIVDIAQRHRMDDGPTPELSPRRNLLPYFAVLALLAMVIVVAISQLGGAPAEEPPANPRTQAAQLLTRTQVADNTAVAADNLEAIMQELIDGETATTIAGYTNTPTPTNTPTNTPSMTPTATPNATLTFAFEQVQTVNAREQARTATAESVTQIAQLTADAPTNTPLPSPTPTLTPTLTPTSTPTLTPTAIPTNTPTATIDIEATANAQGTAIARQTEIFEQAIATENANATANAIATATSDARNQTVRVGTIVYARSFIVLRQSVGLDAPQLPVYLPRGAMLCIISQATDFDGGAMWYQVNVEVAGENGSTVFQGWASETIVENIQSVPADSEEGAICQIEVTNADETTADQIAYNPALFAEALRQAEVVNQFPVTEPRHSDLADSVTQITQCPATLEACSIIEYRLPMSALGGMVIEDWTTLPLTFEAFDDSTNINAHLQPEDDDVAIRLRLPSQLSAGRYQALIDNDAEQIRLPELDFEVNAVNTATNIDLIGECATSVGDVPRDGDVNEFCDPDFSLYTLNDEPIVITLNAQPNAGVFLQWQGDVEDTVMQIGGTNQEIAFNDAGIAFIQLGADANEALTGNVQMRTLSGTTSAPDVSKQMVGNVIQVPLVIWQERLSGTTGGQQVLIAHSIGASSPAWRLVRFTQPPDETYREIGSMNFFPIRGIEPLTQFSPDEMGFSYYQTLSVSCTSFYWWVPEAYMTTSDSGQYVWEFDDMGRIAYLFSVTNNPTLSDIYWNTTRTGDYIPFIVIAKIEGYYLVRVDGFFTTGSIDSDDCERPYP